MIKQGVTKPFVLRLDISLRYTGAIVVQRPCKLCVAYVSSAQRELRTNLLQNGESPRSVKVARLVGNILAERLSLKNVSRVHLDLEKEAIKQKRDPKRFMALVEGIQEKGIEIAP